MGREWTAWPVAETTAAHGPGREGHRGLCLFVLRQRQDQVRKLIAGSGVWICNQCVVLCVEILAEP
jgi:hypothetical protein